MNTKICTKCGEEKVATSEFFYKQEGGKYGVASRCRQCVKIYTQQNKEKIVKRNKKYHQENREKILKRKKQYHQENREKIANKDKKWRQANKERITERERQYCQKNKYLFRQKSAKRRASKLNQTPGYVNLDLIKLIYGHCPEGYHVDHMIPLANGGVHYESNLCYLPAGINLAKGAKSIEEFGLDVFNHHVIYWQDVLSQE
mgnify:CR=1 FL=1|jgi:hypothetical protein